MVEEEIGARLSLKNRKEFSDDARKASRDVKDIGDQADKVDKKARNMAGGLGVASKGIGGMTRMAGMGVAAGAALGAAAGVASVKVLQLGMDAAETQSKFDTVFKGMSGATAKWVDQMNSDFGIPRKELQDAAATFGVFGKAAGVPSKNLEKFSTDLTGAGMDLASFYNADQGDVFLALKSGLAGEAEPLRAFGIFMSDAAMKAEALSMGLGKGKVDADALATAQTKLAIAQAKHGAAVKKYGANSVQAAQSGLTLKSSQDALAKVTSGATVELTEAQKVMVRQSLIMKGLGDAQGDLKRTSGGLANQWRGLKGRFTEAGTAIGTAFLPYATSLVNTLNDKVQPAVKWLQDELPGYVKGGMNAMADFFVAAENVWNSGGSFGEMAASLTGLSAVEDPVNRVADALGDVWVIVRDGLMPAVRDVQNALPGVTQPLNILDSTLDFLAEHTTLVHVALIGVVAAFTLWKTAVIAHTAVMAISGGLMAARVGLTMLLTGATGLSTAAELTKNQALVASIALHARMGAMMIWSLARTVASTAGNLAMAAAMGVVRGAVMAWTAAQWLLNVALSMNPIGLVVIGIMLLVGAFVLAWKKSEAFRDVVTGALGAVLDAGKAVWGWIKGNWPLLLAILTGPFGLAVLAITKNIDAIKGGIKGAINFLIDAWNGLEFKMPTVDTHIPGVGKVGGFTLGTPDIPRLHTGGTTRTGGAANIRPDEEIVILPPAATVVPTDDDTVDAALGRRGGPGDGPMVLQLVVDRKVLAEAVYDHTADKGARE